MNECKHWGERIVLVGLSFIGLCVLTIAFWYLYNAYLLTWNGEPEKIPKQFPKLNEKTGKYDHIWIEVDSENKNQRDDFLSAGIVLFFTAFVLLIIGLVGLASRSF
ncbi:MAG: hypothetical protein CV087_23000 [Candidatus Brocadia sp. WS118]|nr:MAG: hypothetical protein CV087_23000 [Candidatus Brocadia sp. WS118]